MIRVETGVIKVTVTSSRVLRQYLDFHRSAEHQDIQDYPVRQFAILGIIGQVAKTGELSDDSSPELCASRLVLIDTGQVSRRHFYDPRP